MAYPLYPNSRHGLPHHRLQTWSQTSWSLKPRWTLKMLSAGSSILITLPTAEPWTFLEGNLGSTSLCPSYHWLVITKCQKHYPSHCGETRLVSWACAESHSDCGKWLCRLPQPSLLLLKNYFRVHSSKHLETSSCQLLLTLPSLALDLDSTELHLIHNLILTVRSHCVEEPHPDRRWKPADHQPRFHSTPSPLAGC